MSRDGMTRLELRIRKTDVPLLKEIARVLTTPEMEAQARTWLQAMFPDKSDLKALLTSGPPGDLYLERQPDFGRDVEL